MVAPLGVMVKPHRMSDCFAAWFPETPEMVEGRDRKYLIDVNTGEEL